MRPHGGNSKRFKEDTEVLKSRLADQHFDMSKSPPPPPRGLDDRH